MPFTRLTLAAACAAALLAVPAFADDFQPTYVGPKNADLDITGAAVRFDGTTFTLTATTAAPIGSLSPDAFYVWGINRGAGVPRLLFAGAPPAIRPDLRFDGVYLNYQDGSAVLGGFSFPPTFAFYPGVVTIAGDTLTATLPAALIPSSGFAPRDYQFTVWSHYNPGGGDDPSNAHIASFSRTIQATVPEPATWLMLVTGFAFAGAALRRRPAAAVPA